MSGRSTEIITAFVTLFAARTIREVDPMLAFGELAAHVPDLSHAELSDAADRAKELASEIRSLGHRAARAEEHARRRSAAGR